MAAEKVRFRVVYASSEDADAPASNLALHRPTTTGWQSDKFPAPTQQIIIMFDGFVRVRRLQVLGHEFKIPQRVDVHYSDDKDNALNAPRKARFQKLGHFKFGDNRKYQLQARELKSINTDFTAILLRFTVSQCHVNDLNLFNQVALYGINILGEVVQPLGLLPEVEEPSVDVAQSVDLAQLRPPQQNDAANEFQLDASFDPVTARQIKQLYREKERAIVVEDYAEAKRLKQAIEYLRQVGTEITELEAKKRLAVQDEDFDQAIQIKGQLTNLRAEVSRILAPPPAQPVRQEPPSGAIAPPATRMSGPSRGRGSEPAPAPPPPQQSRLARQSSNENFEPSDAFENVTSEYQHVEPTSLNPDDRPIRPSAAAAAAARAELAEGADQDGQNAFEAYEERVLPAMANAGAATNAADDEVAPPPSIASTTPGDSEPEALRAADLKLAGPFIDLFGELNARKLFSRNWNFRDEALQAAIKQLSSVTDKAQAFSIYCQLLERMCKDRIAQVYLTALDGVEAMLKKLGDSVRPPQVHAAIEGIMAALMAKVGDTNQRLHDATRKTLLTMSTMPCVTPQYISSHALRPIKNQALWRPVHGKLLLQLELLQKHGLGNGLTLDALLRFCTPAFASSNAETRTAATKLIVELWKSVKNDIDPFVSKLKKAQQELVLEGIAAAGGPPFQRETAPRANVPALGASGPVRSPAPPPPNAAAPGVLPDESATLDASQSHADVGQSGAFPEDRCQFCGKQDPRFAEEGDAMDAHFFRECPMLMPCRECSQVVEISTYNEHLVTECEHHENFKTCPRCKAAVPKAEYKQHVQRKNCLAARANRGQCSLCHLEIPNNDKSWQRHLTGVCVQNERTKFFKAKKR